MDSPWLWVGIGVLALALIGSVMIARRSSQDKVANQPNQPQQGQQQKQTQNNSEGTETDGDPCSCTGPDLNCSDFGSHASAQNCFEYCKDNGYGDVHNLDGDNDGSACESLS